MGHALKRMRFGGQRTGLILRAAREVTGRTLSGAIVPTLADAVRGWTAEWNRTLSYDYDRTGQCGIQHVITEHRVGLTFEQDLTVAIRSALHRYH